MVGLLYRFEQSEMVLGLFILFCDRFHLRLQFDYDQRLSSIHTRRNRTPTGRLQRCISSIGHRPLLRLRSLQPPRRPSALLLSRVPPMAALRRHDVE